MFFHLLIIAPAIAELASSDSWAQEFLTSEVDSPSEKWSSEFLSEKPQTLAPTNLKWAEEYLDHTEVHNKPWFVIDSIISINQVH